MIYVALLRGINVGGNNKVSMKELKTLLDSLGFKNVSTYINSGNIIFESTAKDTNKITQKIEAGIKENFGLTIRVLVRDSKNIEKLCKALPAKWTNNTKMRTEIMFLWESMDSPSVIKKLKINPVDTVKHIAGTVVWNFDRKDYNKSALPKIIGTEFYKNMTARNINTVRKLNQLMSAKK